MISTTGRAALVLALCLSLGFHWIALQSVAWATMLVENARHEPLSAAVAKTFDGAHPCDLCHAVATGKKSEKKSEATPAKAKVDLMPPVRLVAFSPEFTRSQFNPLVVRAATRIEEPAIPPPRAV